MGALDVFLNLVMAGLLLATLVYCLKLNKRIKVLQDSKSELARIIREFDASTQRATQNINEIHAATIRFEAGYITASPAPKRKRIERSTGNARAETGTDAVSAVNIAHQMTPIVSVRRAPQRSATRPIGAWSSM